MERHFEGKLYNPRSAEGEPNWQELEQIRELEKALSAHEAFVGLAPYGSVVSGYSTEGSDIDAMVLYDSALFDNDSNSEEELRRIVKATTDYLYKKGGREMHHVGFSDINLDILRNKLSKENKDSNGIYVAADYLRDMYGVVTGEKINEYRKGIYDYFQELPKTKQDEIVESIVLSAATGEGAAAMKYVQRTNEPGQYTVEDWRNRIDAREVLMRKRLSRFLKNPEEKM